MTTPQPGDVASWRREYEARGLTEGELGRDPIAAFIGWLADAEVAGVYEPNAMVVATAAGNAPSARMVLLKAVDERGLVFHTNYRSRKAVELTANPACALLFAWHPLERQVRFEGTTERVEPAESDAYFATRPRGSQLGAWASPQSEPVPGRQYLQDRYQHETDRFANSEQVPRPPHWGGMLVRPHSVEFWQGRPGRMHDRIRFERADATTWVIDRLAP
ncbi:MAG: pyridoxamine 5'-phosphate oxidase [Nocardioidaceae bacterium]